MSRRRAWPLRLVSRARHEHRILAGIVDAALSSLATFIVGFYATRVLDPVTLGGYALAFSVFVLSGFVPAQLVFAPTEIVAVGYPRRQQLPLLRQSLARGAIASVIAAVVTSSWAFVAPGDLSSSALEALVVTCAAATFVSPLQDHLRRMLHVAQASWRSVIVAVVQIVVALGAVVAMPATGIGVAAVPFGALAIANVASLTAGILLSVRDLAAPASHEPLGLDRVLRSGRPLLAVGVIPSATTFVVSWLVSTLAGPAVLGYVEASRIVSQPVAVLQNGLGIVLGPRATRAASQRDTAAARSVNRLFQGLIVGAGVAWLVAVAVPAPWNLLTDIVPTAYAVTGLVAASVSSFTVLSLSLIRRYELYGAGREREAARAELEGNTVRTALALAVGPLGAFAVPVGQVALGILRFVRYRGWLDAYYRESADDLPRAGDLVEGGAETRYRTDDAREARHRTDDGREARDAADDATERAGSRTAHG